MRALCGKYQVTARLVDYSSLFTLQPSALSLHYAVRPQAPMQLVVPSAVSAAVKMDITTCITVFQVSRFILLIF